MNLHLSLKGEYFLAILSGEKLEEYREVTPFWEKRLVGRSYDKMVITWGYPKGDDTDKRIILPYFGYRLATLTHRHFGPDPVQVFAIDVSHCVDFRVV